MAKAWRIDGLDCNANAAIGIEAILRTRFAEVVSFRDAAATEDHIDGVHDMRVALRRLRSILRSFRELLDSDAFEKVKEDLKDLSDTLGKVRDQDVAVEALDKLAGEIDDEQARDRIEEIKIQIQTRREPDKNELCKVLEQSKIDLLEKEFIAALENGVKSTDDTLYKTGRVVLAIELENFLKRSKSIYRPDNFKALHKFRIAAKRLRYVLEPIAVCNESLSPFAESISELQSALGKLQDANVWIDNFKKREEQKSADLWLLEYFVRQRGKSYTRAAGLWAEWDKDGFIKVRLRKAISEASIL